MRSDLQTLVDDMVRDELSRITPIQRDTALGLAVTRYSTDRPRTLCEAVAAPGGPRLPLPSSWEATSRLVSIEWPVDQSPVSTVAGMVHRVPSGQQIVTDEVIGAGDAAYITFTAAHLVTDATDTVPAEHQEAVAAWAAGILFDQLAAKSAGNSDPTIQADATDQRTPAQEYATRARACRKRYADVLGVSTEPKAQGASATVTWPATRRHPGIGAVPAGTGVR